MYGAIFRLSQCPYPVVDAPLQSVCSVFFQCLCISPTYELALQIGQVIEQMGKFCPDVKLAYGVRGNRSKNVAIFIITNGIIGSQ